jgi:hypothetical protein
MVPQYIARWFIVKNHFEMDDDWGYPHDFGNLHRTDIVYT